MKKILYVLALVAVLFGATACSGTLHDAEVMLVDKVVVQGLTKLAGVEMAISGNFIPNAAGEVNPDNWFHGEGDKSVLHPGAVAVVGGDGTIEFKLGVVTSEAQLKFLGKANEPGWVEATRFGAFAYRAPFGSDAVVANSFTGSLTPKTILGVVQADESIVWTVVDAIAENRVKIDQIIMFGLPASYQGEYVEFAGFGGNAVAAPVSLVDGDGVLFINFLAPVILGTEEVEFSLSVVGTPAMRIAGVIDAAGGSVATIANPASGPDRTRKIYGAVQPDGSVEWSISDPANNVIASWEIVDAVATETYIINGSLFGWGLGWDGGNTAKITASATGEGSYTFPTAYVGSIEDEFTGVVLDADGGADWGTDRMRPDGANIKIKNMIGYDAAQWVDDVPDSFVLRLTRNAANDWDWELVD